MKSQLSAMSCRAMHDLALAYLSSIIYYYSTLLTSGYSSYVNPKLILTSGTEQILFLWLDCPFRSSLSSFLDFPVSPVVKTLNFHYRGHGFTLPDWGSATCLVVKPKKQKAT